MTVEDWLAFASRRVVVRDPRQGRASSASTWSGTRSWPQTPEGYYQVQGGIPYAIAKSLAAAPFADLLWMETKTADLEDAQEFADAIHAVFPDKMLAYNLSPSFNWDTTGMSDDEMRNFPGGAGEDGLRLQLHHLRRPPDRRPRGGGVHDRAARGRHARPGPPAAQVPPARVALPHPADPRRRPAGRRRARARRPDTRPRPRPWARARRRASTWSRPRSRRRSWRAGSPSGPSTTASTKPLQRLAAAAHRRAATCSS